jgi:hypothetical protein
MLPAISGCEVYLERWRYTLSNLRQTDNPMVDFDRSHVPSQRTGDNTVSDSRKLVDIVQPNILCEHAFKLG